MPQIKQQKNANGKYESDYPFSYSTSSVIPYMYDPLKKTYSIVCIRRGQEPFKDMLAFAGGFQEAGTEPLEATAVRELLEETNIAKSVGELKLVCVQSSPTRDPRGVIIDHVYEVKVTPNDLLKAKAGDDADALELVEISEETLKYAMFNTSNREALVKRFAFDHGLSLIEFYRVN